MAAVIEPSVATINQDLDLTKSFQIVDASDLKKDSRTLMLERFMSAENLGHSEGYKVYKPGDTAEIPEQDGTVNTYDCQQLEAIKGNGVYGNIQICQNKPKININFQGTNFFGGDGTLTADLREGGAGFLAYKENEALILEQVVEALETAAERFPGEKVEIEISGHSLGAALTQHFHASLLKAMANSISFRQLGLTEEQQMTFDAVGSISANLINPAGVNQRVEQEVKLFTEALHLHKGLKSKASLLYVGGDPVQAHQETNAYADMDPRYMDVELVKMKKGYEGMTTSYLAAAAAAGGAVLATGLTGGLGALAVAFGGYFLSKATGGVCAHLSTHLDATKSVHEQDPYLKFEHHSNQDDKGRQTIKEKCRNKSFIANGLLSAVHTIGRLLPGSSSSKTDKASKKPITTMFDRNKKTIGSLKSCTQEVMSELPAARDMHPSSVTPVF